LSLLRGLSVAGVVGAGSLGVVVVTGCEGPPVAFRKPDPPLRDRRPQEQESAEEAHPHLVVRSSVDRVAPGEEVFFRVDISVPRGGGASREPINLAMVFDRSGSMGEEGKLERALEAARLAVSNLTPEDVVSLTVFSDQATVLSPTQYAVNPAYVLHRLDEVEAQGWTNLSAGLLEGLNQIRESPSDDARSVLLLLSDGLANRGVTDSAVLARMVSRAQDVVVSTFGVGEEFDERLLTALARAGRGRYSYVHEAESIPQAVGAELGRLLEVRAQNASLRISPGAGLGPARFSGSVSETEADPESPVILGDLAEGESLLYVVAATADPEPRVPAVVEEFTLTWDDAATGVRRSETRRVEIPFAKPGETAHAAEDVVLLGRLGRALEEAELAVRSRDERAARAVLHRIRTDFPRLREAAMATNDQEVLNRLFLFEHFAEELDELLEGGLLHSHGRAYEESLKDLNWRRYLLEHHRGEPH